MEVSPIINAWDCQLQQGQGLKCLTNRTMIMNNELLLLSPSQQFSKRANCLNPTICSVG